MPFTPWITQSYLKQLTPINNNVDVSEVANHIETCQIINTREILGKNLYDDLNTKFIAGTLNTIETELFEILKQSIAYRSSEIAIPFLHIKIRNKGVVKLRDEYAEPASLEDMKYLRHELKNRAEYFEKRAKDFLCQFSIDFPLYTQDTNPHNQVYPNYNEPYDSDIYLEDHESWILRRNKYLYGPNGSEPGNRY
jgi:hypothetical protein